MDKITCCIIPTAEQLSHLSGPKTIESLLAADFLGNQLYINEWIFEWSQRNDIDHETLPLCVEQTILTDRKVARHYHRYIKSAIVSHDIEWLRSHYIVAYDRVWNYVDFKYIPFEMFCILWNEKYVPFNFLTFVCASKRLNIWAMFVDAYGPTECLSTAIKQRYNEGCIHCLNEGADLTKKDFVKDAMLLDGRIFKAIVDMNPPATKEAFENFKLWKSINRLQDVALVEEFFWINGFRD